MKTMDYLKKCLRPTALFFVIGMAIFALGYYKVAKSDKGTCRTHGTNCPTRVMCKAKGLIFDYDMKCLKDINESISKMETQKQELNEKLCKARKERNRDYGMVTGMYFYPAHDLAELTALEDEIANVDSRIAALKVTEEAIANKYNINLKQVAFIK